MFGDHFYHKQIRNTVIAFGTIFNNINIKRLDSSGNPLQNIKVPLSYSPKEKFLARLDQQEDLTGDDSSVAITLPRMAFDIVGYSYDPSRKLNKNQRLGKVTTNADTSFRGYGVSYAVNEDISVSYNVGTVDFELANSEDQETTAVGISYTSGGITVSGSMHDGENLGGSAATTADRNDYELNIAFAF